MGKISLTLIIVSALLFVSCRERLYYLDATSPNQTYNVELKEVEKAPLTQGGMPFHVLLRIIKRGNVFLDNETIYSRDDVEEKFTSIASEPSWESENILKLGWRKKDSSMKQDRIEVYNDTDEPLNYALISWDLEASRPNEQFIILDLDPKERITFGVTIPLAAVRDGSHVACRGKFRNGKQLTLSNWSFDLIGSSRSVAHYTITIRSDQTTINCDGCEGITPRPKT